MSDNNVIFLDKILLTPEGELTWRALEICHKYAVFYITEQKRNLQMEREYRELEDVFHDIRVDPEVAMFHFLPVGKNDHPSSDLHKGVWAEASIVEKWPSILGSMLILSKINIKNLIEELGLDVQLSDYAYSVKNQAWNVFSPITDEHLALLANAGGIPSSDSIATFLSSVWRFHERYGGESNKPYQHHYKRAVYSLVYLVQCTPLIQLFLNVYVPLLQHPQWDDAFRYRIAHTFASDVENILYNFEEIEAADDHAPFDWHYNLNKLDQKEREVYVLQTGLEPLDHPSFPPQDVWLWHTNLQPTDDEQYHKNLKEYYEAEGHQLR